MDIHGNDNELGMPDGLEVNSKSGTYGADPIGDPLERMLDQLETSMNQPFSLLENLHQDSVSRELEQVEKSGMLRTPADFMEAADAATNAPAHEVSPQPIHPAGPLPPSAFPAEPPLLSGQRLMPPPIPGPKRVKGGSLRRRQTGRPWSLFRWPFFRRFRYGRLTPFAAMEAGEAELYCELYGMRVDVAGCVKCPNLDPVGDEKDGQCRYAFPDEPEGADEETPRESPSVGEDDADE